MLNCSITPFFKFSQRTTCDTLQNENDICIINVSKRITLTHTHIVSHPDGLSSLSLSSTALSRWWETAVSSVSLQSLSPPSSTSLIEHHSHMLRFHASSFTLTLFLSISVSFSFTYSPVIMPHPPLSLSSPLPVCFRLHISSSNWLFSVAAELHLPVFGKRTFS